ncbi:MAG: recombinase family protein [Alphaproteobacteria bacterium]|nr:recombinase family protein [Alphaproteobacteria bacterium]
MIYGYIRKSTEKQSYKHQEYEIIKYAQNNGFKIGEWIEETISSRKDLNKRSLGKLLNHLQAYDILITTEISRISRSVPEIFTIIQTCLNKKCQIITIKENYRLGDDLQSQVMAFCFGIAAQIERDLISQRTKCSLASKKAQGIKLGRPLGATSKRLKLTKNTNRIKELLSKGLPKAQIARILGVQRMTLSRFLLRMGFT